MTEMVFQKKTLGKSLFHCQNDWSGHGSARLSEKMLGPAGPQVFIFGRQNKSCSRQKLYLRTIEIQ